MVVLPTAIHLTQQPATSAPLCSARGPSPQCTHRLSGIRALPCTDWFTTYVSRLSRNSHPVVDSGYLDLLTCVQLPESARLLRRLMMPCRHPPLLTLSNAADNCTGGNPCPREPTLASCAQRGVTASLFRPCPAVTNNRIIIALLFSSTT